MRAVVVGTAIKFPPFRIQLIDRFSVFATP